MHYGAAFLRCVGFLEWFMLDTLHNTPVLQAWLGEEFVPLQSAALHTYLHLTEVAEAVCDPGSDQQLIALVCAAISTVAPVYMMSAGGRATYVLSASEVDELIFRPLRRDGRGAKLEGLRIQRRDLETAVSVLKQARAALQR